ncbi:hypothetical protein [Cytobacillus gottheilii]|uniref:hypothetical protein n=1 Tax=Cytobacillus gottheilii TaxID=859144 RepID=UPI0009BAB90E|nr:hypothetical protein [Cytobacillus gottheilii]
MNMIDKNKVVTHMERRLAALQDRRMRDFSGGTQSDIFAIRELEYWLSCFKRGVYDMKLWENEGM